MSNPFAALQDFGDEDENFVKPQDNKAKKTDKKPKQEKKMAPRKNEPAAQGEDLPSRTRDNAKIIRNKRQPKPTKQIPEGHTLDRRSGTGRVDKPRKAGGGYGNVGNVHDIQNKEKYIKEGQEEKPAEQAIAQQVKPEEPQNITLEEYYKNRGVDLTVTAGRKQAPKKGEINADWLKKEKLTLMQTKQDIKNEEREKAIKQNQKKKDLASQNEEQNHELLGFKSRTQKKPREQMEQRQPKQAKQRGPKGPKGKKTEKVVINQDDFPAL